jgi:HPt (histidine-containing phosphotransfer) domain-containing protein
MTDEVVPPVLRNRYLESFPSKADAFAAALEAVDLKHDAKEIRALRDLAHKLAGSAGMYGFDDLGLLAREIVRAIDTGAPLSIVGAYTRDLVGHLSKQFVVRSIKSGS